MDVVAEARGDTHGGLWLEPQRRRLVRLCAAITGDRDAAEDLAQEALLEAWRNAHKLHDPAGAERWLAAIARNVCLRWARRRGRDLAALAPLDAEPGDLDDELERAELVDLVDRALAILPPETRDVLVRRYVDDAPHAEIGAGLGISEDAVGMRLSRGKAVLRRLLAAELGTADDGWEQTRVWCTECGACRLLARRDPAIVELRCPGCCAGVPGTRLPLADPLFARLVGDAIRPTAIIGRVAEWSRVYYAAGAGEQVACTRCDRPATARTYGRPSSAGGLLVECDSCGNRVSSSAGALALAQPEARRLRRTHPRIRALPTRTVEHEGTAALVLRYESLLGSAGVDVLFAHDTLRVLKVA